jgi:sialidase-1
MGATSKDGGKTWSKMFAIPELPDPACQASILRYTWADQQGKSRVLFCNPGVPWDEMTRGRHTGTVRLSYDEGKTWPVAKLLNKHKSFFGYSCLTALPDGTIGVLFESNGCAKASLPSKGIEAEKYHATFARFSLEWLTDGKDSLER